MNKTAAAERVAPGEWNPPGSAPALWRVGNRGLRRRWNQPGAAGSACSPEEQSLPPHFGVLSTECARWARPGRSRGAQRWPAVPSVGRPGDPAEGASAPQDSQASLEKEAGSCLLTPHTQDTQEMLKFSETSVFWV